MPQTISIKKQVLSENDQLAQSIRQKLDTNHLLSINVMASPGAGKTSLILNTIRALKNNFSIGVIDGDVSDIDVTKLKQEDVPVMLANTGGACHLDAVMVDKALSKLNLKALDLLIVENVGNLICPANFTLGTHFQIVIASVPEGADKPHKYPGMFLGADMILVNKMDYADIEQFDWDFFLDGVRQVNKQAQILPISCKTGKGLHDWIAWLTEKLKNPRL